MTISFVHIVMHEWMVNRMDDDHISRKAAIDAIRSIFAPTPTQKDMVEYCLEIIENLPSAEEESFEWCHDCKEYDQSAYCCHRWTKVIRNTVEEIRRAEKERENG